MGEDQKLPPGEGPSSEEEPKTPSGLTDPEFQQRLNDASKRITADMETRRRARRARDQLADELAADIKREKQGPAQLTSIEGGEPTPADTPAEEDLPPLIDEKPAIDSARLKKLFAPEETDKSGDR